MFQNTIFNYSIFEFPEPEELNRKLLNDFSELKNHNEIKRTHLFNGRYENIYVSLDKTPELKPVLEFASQCAQQVLDLNKALDIGYWFNDMPPQSVTIPHTHDDDDELLSGAYYIKVPENSGNLIITTNKNKKEITPKEGQLILFKADCQHEVTKNNSQQDRLSIGMNFGLKQF